MSPLPSPRRSRCATLAALFLLVATTSLAQAEARPPIYRDAAHVSRGCLISTLAYLARFTTEHPHEQGLELEVMRRGVHDEAEPHTLAAVTWAGRWWLRDEYLGVLPLDLATGPAVAPERLRERCETALTQGAKNYLRLGSGLPWPEAPVEWNAAERRREITRAHRLLPLPATVYLVGHGAEEVALLLFRPGAGRVALYDPAHGTATARTASTDDARLVTTIAGLLGYQADRVRAAP